MKKLLIVVVILISGFVYWQNNFHNNQIEALYDTPYIVVYGRDSCGWSQKYLSDLKNERLKFIYKKMVITKELISNCILEWKKLA
jgi:hypothetical protein